MTAPITSVAASTATAQDRPALRKAAEAFEAVFLRQIMADMRKAKLADDIFGSGATDNFRELADSNSAEQLAKRGAFGIAELIERQFAGKAGKS